MRSFFVLAAICLQAPAFGQTSASDHAGTDGIPMVLTPTRLRQSLQDVPASVTVITSDMLQRFGILSLPDALRLVPGMEITQPTGNDFRINYHGTNVLSPRRLNVLIDGVSAYQPLFARVDWANLPVAMDDIDRIEVTRGPDSASYGPDSMMAVVNIITKHPADVERLAVVTTAGSNKTVSSTARLGFSQGSTTARASISRDENGGYDALSRSASGHDSSFINRLNFRSDTQFDLDTSLNLEFGFVEGTREVPFVEKYQQSSPDIQVHEHVLEATLTHSFSNVNEAQVRAHVWSNSVGQAWRSCIPTPMLLPQMAALFRANPAYAFALLQGKTPTGGTSTDDALAQAASAAIKALGANAAAPICGTANQDERSQRTDLELQDTAVLSESLRLVGGVGLRHDSGSSQTFLDGFRSDNAWRLFLNAEYRPIHAITLNAGAYSERDQLSGGSTSPRAALNWHLDDRQSLRFIWSRSTRTPDVEEQTGHWTYRFDNATPALDGSTTVSFFESGLAKGNLRAERDTSMELGYLINLAAYGTVIDAKLFRDHLTDLISEKLQVADFDPTNDNAVRLSGFEMQANAQLPDDWFLFAQYGYLLNQDATTPLERTQYSRNSGALGVSKKFGSGWSASMAAYAQSGDGVAQSPYGRLDLSIGRTVALGGGSHLDATLLLRRLNRNTQTSYQDTGRQDTATYNDRSQIFGQLRLAF